MSMIVLSTMVAVIKSAPIHQNQFSVAVTLDTHWMLMEELALVESHSMCHFEKSVLL